METMQLREKSTLVGAFLKNGRNRIMSSFGGYGNGIVQN